MLILSNLLAFWMKSSCQITYYQVNNTIWKLRLPSSTEKQTLACEYLSTSLLKSVLYSKAVRGFSASHTQLWIKDINVLSPMCSGKVNTFSHVVIRYIYIVTQGIFYTFYFSLSHARTIQRAGGERHGSPDAPVVGSAGQDGGSAVRGRGVSSATRSRRGIWAMGGLSLGG